jgi:hypothetical protein
MPLLVTGSSVVLELQSSFDFRPTTPPVHPCDSCARGSAYYCRGNSRKAYATLEIRETRCDGGILLKIINATGENDERAAQNSDRR